MMRIWTTLLIFGVAVSALAWAVIALREHGLNPMRNLVRLLRRPAWELSLLTAVVIGFIHHGATKGTNGVNGAGGEMGGELLNVANVEMLPITNINAQLGTLATLGNGNIGTGNNFTLATLNTAPTTNSDWLAFGGYEDWFYLDGGGWCFRFGSNLVERLTVFSCGEISPAPYDASNRISLLGLPLAILPAANWHLLGDGEWGMGNGEQGTGNCQLPTTNYQLKSLFCHEETPSNTLLLTWQNALVNRDMNLPVTVQAELFPDGAAAFRYDFSGIGDISALSNAETQIWRDGVLASNYQLPTTNYQLSTTNYQLTSFFDAPPITGTNMIGEVYTRIAGGNTNAYYCADVVVEKGPAKIRVEPMADETNRGLLGAYEIVAMPGETNRLPLLIGPKYTVSAETAFESFELVPPPFVPLADDTGTVERLEFGEAFSATNVTDRLVEVQWPVEFALEEIDATPEATTYALRVTPDWLDGVVTWHGIVDTNAPPMRGAPPMRSGGASCSCGCLLRDGLDLIHSQTCSCEHCSAEGECLYEGHTEDISIDMKDSSSGGEPPGPGGGGGNDTPPPNLPSVSVSFDKNVVIFEDRYEDSPGVFVDRRSTTTKLTINAYGGENGALISLSISSALELYSSDGNMPTYVMPGGIVEWEAYYKGTAPSDGVGGTTVSASIIDYLTFESESASDFLTVVEVKVKSQNTAPQNPCWQRHSYGVCERVVLQHTPIEAQVTWTAPVDITIGAATNSQYKLLVCPVLGGMKNVTSAIGDVDLDIPLNIVEPQAIVASNISFIAGNIPGNVAGHVGMLMDQYVSPFTVSFTETAIEEVPCETGFHSGYYADSSWSNRWSHTYDNGAGKWVRVNAGNYIVRDRPSCGACPPPWSQGTLIWDIPFGWHSLGSNNMAPTMGTTPNGEFATETKSTTVITASGMVFVMKLGHWVSRDIYNEVALDGVVVREGNQ